MIFNIYIYWLLSTVYITSEYKKKKNLLKNLNSLVNSQYHQN